MLSEGGCHSLALERAASSQQTPSQLLVRPLVALPHTIALVVACGAGLALSLLAGLIVIFTGRYPKAMFDYTSGAFAWAMRLLAYACLLTDRRPPFSLGQRPAYPGHLELDYYPDGRIARWRPAASWLIVLPQLASLLVVYASIVVMVVLSLFSLAFTRDFPAGVYDFVVRALRFQAHVIAFALFLTDSYPRFAL